MACSHPVVVGESGLLRGGELGHAVEAGDGLRRGPRGDEHVLVKLEGEVHHIRGGVDGDEHVLVKLVGSLVQWPGSGMLGLGFG